MKTSNYRVFIALIVCVLFTITNYSQVLSIDDNVKKGNIPFSIIEKVPVFPGCTGNEQSKRDCLNMSMKKHVAEKFNMKVVPTNELSKGQQKIYVQFMITTKGKVKIIGVRAPHKKLKKEAKKVVKKLPKMIPGEQKGKSVNVTYMLPIVFEVQ
ncbi:energy transducer TonB [Urechidicola croceus]|uniref:TonB C-terminal domain-containing protein n=1 Tax=Urechidicola croceus TaxID=1850246 RepID=A0A1D8PAT5_9FLAO|nr:energy transducer TonB [Urechidicola croceus]AOW21693.1 hypothetical protein LPB138_13825 [Urechidicola croceus]